MFGQGERLCRGEGEDKRGGCMGLCVGEGYYGVTGLLLFSSRNSGLGIGLLLLLLFEEDEQSSVVCKFCV